MGKTLTEIAQQLKDAGKKVQLIEGDIRDRGAVASALRATAQPSLLDSTMTGLPCSEGRNTRSQLT